MCPSSASITSGVDVSVIMPVIREREAAEAVASALAQEAVSVEVIALDDTPSGSAEANIRGINDPRVRYIRLEQRSGGKPGIVRNEGARLAHGRYVHFLDDDDHLLPGALRALVDALDSHRSVGVAIGRVVPFGADDMAVEETRAWAAVAARHAARTSGWRLLATASLLFQASMLVPSTCLVRRGLMGYGGGFDPRVPLIDDVEFFARVIRRFGHVFVDHPVLHRRTGAPSMTFSSEPRGAVAAGGDGPTPIVQGYQRMYQKYRETHGSLEFFALKLLARTLLRWYA